MYTINLVISYATYILTSLKYNNFIKDKISLIYYLLETIFKNNTSILYIPNIILLDEVEIIYTLY